MKQPKQKKSKLLKPMYYLLILASVMLALTKIYAMFLIGFSLKQLLYTCVWLAVAFGGYKRVKSI